MHNKSAAGHEVIKVRAADELMAPLWSGSLWLRKCHRCRNYQSNMFFFLNKYSGCCSLEFKRELDLKRKNVFPAQRSVSGRHRSSTHINKTQRVLGISPPLLHPKARAAMFVQEGEQNIFAKSDLVKGHIKYWSTLKILNESSSTVCWCAGARAGVSYDRMWWAGFGLLRGSLERGIAMKINVKPLQCMLKVDTNHLWACSWRALKSLWVFFILL